MVEELSQIETICLCITSRISIVPPDCEILNIPTLSMESACDAFYRIYKNGERPKVVGSILEQLEFHPLSITLLATTASRNGWGCDRLAQEWGARRTQVLRTDYNESLARTIELSLASPLFCELGPNARGLLGVVAFFPQGVDEKNLDWFFSSIPDRRNIFDKFCVLSLTYRSNGFITMLAPLRDYLCPEDPTSFPLLHTIKECYFERLSVDVNPDRPGYEEAQWITSEDVNVEHLLDVFMSIDTHSDDVWDACAHFMRHIYWHKPRLVVLGPKLEGLSDDHPSKPTCLYELSRSFESVGNFAERKRLLVHTLKLWRERGDDFEVAKTLSYLSYANQQLFLYEEGILQAKESFEIYERFNDILGQAISLRRLAWLLYCDEQLDAAGEAASQSIALLPDSEQFLACEGHRVLSKICRYKGETEKAINHLETALGTVSSFNWSDEICWILYDLAKLFREHSRFDEANAHVERAKSHAGSDVYTLGRATELQARIWYEQGRLEEAKSEALRAADVYGKIGAAADAMRCQEFLQDMEEEERASYPG